MNSGAPNLENLARAKQLNAEPPGKEERLNSPVTSGASGTDRGR
jgi:hypothetical protein